MRTSFYLFGLAVSLAVGVMAAPQNYDITEGDSIFLGRGNCSTCHEVNGRGGVVGPDLPTAGTRGADALRAKIVDPNAPAGGRGGGPQVVVAKRADGREIQGVRRSEDTFNLQ